MEKNMIDVKKTLRKIKKAIKILFLALAEMSMIDICDYSEDPFKCIQRDRHGKQE